MRTLAGDWMIDGVSWLCHVVADLTCSYFIHILHFGTTYLQIAWMVQLPSWRWCMVESKTMNPHWTDALRGRWLTMVFGHCLGRWTTKKLAVAEQTRVVLGRTLEICGSQGTVYQANVHRWNFSMLGWEDNWPGPTGPNVYWCVIQQWE